MFIAQELRKKNIAEYLLYMWQIEDTIRAFDCSLTRIKREYVERFDYTDEQKEEEIDWFGNLIRMMNQEGCREKGHLQINKVTLQMLIESRRSFPSIIRNTTRYCHSSWSCVTVGPIRRRTRSRRASTHSMA